MTMERCHLVGRAIIAVQPGVGHVRLSESDTPCQRLCRPGTTGKPLLSWMLPTPTFWRAGLLERLGPGTTQLPHLPTTISHTAPCQGRMGANKQDDMWEESQIKMQERDLPKCNQATFTLCISTLYVCRQGRIIGHRDNPDNATSAARR